MIISHKHRFIFLKTRKTGGSSVQVAMTSVCGDDDIVVGNDSDHTGENSDRNLDHSFTRNAHANLPQIKLALPAEIWISYLKVAFVRNPWDLALSRYHWEKKGMDCDVMDFRNWIADYTSQDWIEPEYNGQGNIIQRVWDVRGGYVRDLQAPFALENGQLAVDFLGRYERLDADFGTLCRKLSVSPPQLPHLKSGFRLIGAYQDAYDEICRRRVENAFAADIDAFEYQF